MISIEHSGTGIENIGHLVKADEFRNTQFINGVKILEVLLVFADDLHLASR